MKKNKDRKLYFGSIIAFILIASLCFVFNFNYQNKVEAAPNSTIFLDPASISVKANEGSSLIAKIRPGTNKVSAVELHLVFDRTKIRVDNIVPNATAFPDVLQAVQINNNNGTASVILGSGSSNFVTTESAIATISFTAIATGSSNMNLTGTLAAASGEGSTNVVTSLTGSQINITSAVVTYDNSDFAVLAFDWLQTKTSPADINLDGIVNSKDLGIMMSNWGN